MFVISFLSIVSSLLILGNASGGPTEDAVGIYQSGDYESAIPLLQAAAARSPKDGLIRADLLSALVYEGRVDQASDLADASLADFPNSPEVIAARGEFAYYMSDFGEAEKLFRAATKLKDETPRAYYGLYRLYRAASLYRTARLFCLKAHQIDPDDALITAAFIHYLTPEKRREMEPPFISAHPWFYKHFEQYEQTSTEVNGELKERHAFELDGDPKEASLHLIELRDSPTRIRGVGIEMSFQGGQRLRLLFDTGTSGILVTQASIDRAGLNHLGSFEARGIGDKGPKNAFVAVADRCEIGSLKYKTCVIRAIEGKHRAMGDDDGLIGADFFSGFIIRVDFEKRELNLTPQPDRPPNPQGYDRAAGSSESGFTPVFRSGHALFALTKVNGRNSGLFLLDTGSGLSAVDSTFAKLSTKIHGDEYMHVHGISGEVKDVFEADKAELQFAHFRQRNLGLTSFNLNNSPEHQDFRMAGILGFPVLSLMRSITIDYRNGLVDFDYVRR